MPEYILDQLLNHPDLRVRETALRTKTSSNLFVAQRKAMAAQNRAMAGLPALTHSHANAVSNPSIQVFTANNGSSLPGSQLPNPQSDQAGKEAFDGLMATFKFYSDVHNRNSIDDGGMSLIATVHFSEDGSGRYDNAFWNGSQMVFGDGDGVLFHRFTISLDVIGHELAHGVTDAAGGITYQGQSGAVNEHMSDVFGSLVKQYAKGQTADQADWLLGKEFMVSAPCLRSMADPHQGFGTQPGNGQPGQPNHMNEYNNLSSGVDNGGVHVNSGIPNHAFYQVAKLLGGNAWTSAGRVWYETLTAKSNTISANCTFQELANFTAKFAIDLANPDGGRNGRAHTAVTLGWKEVGITVADPSTKTSVPVPPTVPPTIPPTVPPTPNDLQAKLDSAKAALQEIQAKAGAALAGL